MEKILFAFLCLAFAACGDDGGAAVDSGTPVDGGSTVDTGVTGDHPRVATIVALTGDATAGAALYVESPRVGCVGCHGTDGTDFGPGLVDRIPTRTNEQIANVLMSGAPASDTYLSGMGSYAGVLSDQEAADLVAYLRDITDGS